MSEDQGRGPVEALMADACQVDDCAHASRQLSAQEEARCDGMALTLGSLPDELLVAVVRFLGKGTIYAQDMTTHFIDISLFACVCVSSLMTLILQVQSICCGGAAHAVRLQRSILTKFGETCVRHAG